MNLVTKEEFIGAKMLSSVPSYLEKVEVKRGDSVIEMGNLSSLRKFMIANEKADTYRKESMSKTDEHKSGVKNYGEFLTLLENGDDKVTSQIKTITNDVVSDLRKVYQEELIGYKFDVTGEFFDVGLVLSGAPESWLEPEFKPIEKTRIEVLINSSYSWKIDYKVIIKNASRLLAIAKLLEEHNVEVKIKTFNICDNLDSRDRNHTCYIVTDVKDYDEPINYQKCSSLISPSYNRRACLKVKEMVYENNLLGGYGKVVFHKGFIRLDTDEDIVALEKKLFKKDK